MSPVAFCGVSGAFVETFTGAGPFLGFENSGWEAIGDAVFDDGGLLIINEAMDFETEVLYRQGRRLQQSGSFRTIVEFRELDLGLAEDHHLKLGGFGFSHLLGDDVGGGIGVQLLERQIGDEVGLWGLKLFGVGFHHDEKVQKSLPGEPVRLELVFDAEQSQVEVSYQVANDAPKRIGPFTYEGQVSPDGHNTTLFLSAVGIDQTTSGLLDYWSVVPLDAAEGDFFGDGNLGVDDINMLARAAKVSRPDSVFDIDDSGSVDDGDILYWIQDLMQTYMGDANLDGEFTSSDLVSVFTTGEYEDDIKGNSTWNEGDWNGDTEFTSGDLVLAFTDGGYEQGPRVAKRVPEPGTLILVGTAVVAGWRSRQRRQRIALGGHSAVATSVKQRDTSAARVGIVGFAAVAYTEGTLNGGNHPVGTGVATLQQEFNQDGRLDLLLREGSELYWYLNEGEAGFRRSFFFEFESPAIAATGDLDNDLDSDLPSQPLRSCLCRTHEITGVQGVSHGSRKMTIRLNRKATE